MLTAVLLLILGGVFLYAGGDFLLRGSCAIGRQLGWSPVLIGLVLVSFGTSAPELFVSAGAALQDHGDIAVGNVVGSNILNILLVLGLAVCLVPLTVDKSLRSSQFPLMVGITAVAIWLIRDGSLSRLDGLILVLLALVSILVGFRSNAQLGKDQEHQAAVAEHDTIGTGKALAFILVGVIGLAIGAQAMITGGVGIATALGVPEAIIAMTITAFGTSFPEIAATILAAARRQVDMAVGNVVGSNIFNLGWVLGISSLLKPIGDISIGTGPLTILMLCTLAVALLAWKPGHFPRWAGVVMLLLYGGYTMYLTAL